MDSSLKDSLCEFAATNERLESYKYILTPLKKASKILPKASIIQIPSLFHYT
jgi:hypothetical protein